MQVQKRSEIWHVKSQECKLCFYSLTARLIVIFRGKLFLFLHIIILPNWARDRNCCTSLCSSPSRTSSSHTVSNTDINNHLVHRKNKKQSRNFTVWKQVHFNEGFHSKCLCALWAFLPLSQSKGSQELSIVPYNFFSLRNCVYYVYNFYIYTHTHKKKPSKTLFGCKTAVSFVDLALGFYCCKLLAKAIKG